MRKSSKIFGALAVAGVVAASGSAFTGTGVTSNAGASQFIGGAIGQSVTGATLTSINYTFSDATKTAVSGATVVFADNDSDGKAVAMALANSGGAAVNGTCSAVLASNNTSTCTFSDVTGVTGATVTVS